MTGARSKHKQAHVRIIRMALRLPAGDVFEGVLDLLHGHALLRLFILTPLKELMCNDSTAVA